MTSWYDIYKDRMNKRYEKHIEKKYGFMIDSIVDRDPRRLIELGCGAGNITKAVRNSIERPIGSTLVDICPKMLGLAIENNQDPHCKFICADIRQWNNECKFEFADVAYSHGVLEHFNDSDIAKIIRNIDRFAGKQVHYVPGARYEVPSRGDERLLTKDHWNDIIYNSFDRLYFGKSGIRFSTRYFNDNHDILICITREFI